MKCYNGIYLESRGQTVPCGQCMNCRVNKGRIWSARILMEWLTHGHAVFVTLTYNEEHVPLTVQPDGTPSQTLRKKQFLDWLKNVQKSEVGSLRYYLVGEYGEVSERPHYHMAIFPKSGAQVALFLSKWTKGFTSCYEMSPERARYLAQYAAKKLSGPKASWYGNREPEFRTSSRNPPLSAEMCDHLANTYKIGKGAKIVQERGDIERSIRICGSIYPLGRWCLDRIRKKLDIPLSHSERLSHGGYEEWHQIQEAEYDPVMRHKYEETLGAKKAQRYHRSTTVNV